jgi:hypothetical protein
MNHEIKPTNADTINIGDKNDVDYWIEKFDVTKVRLKAAVNAVGPAVKDVAVYLKK